MAIRLTDTARRYAARFEEVTDVTPRDCVVDDTHDRVVFVVPAAEMGKAIGVAGRRVDRLQTQLDRRVELVEDADTAEAFVANALAPAAVYNVTVSAGETTVAYAEVDHADRGVAIGADGRTIERARTLAARHFDIDDVQLA